MEQVVCFLCDAMVKRRRTLEDHVKVRHFRYHPFACPKCEKTVTSLERYSDHAQDCGTDEKPLERNVHEIENMLGIVIEVCIRLSYSIPSFHTLSSEQVDKLVDYLDAKKKNLCHDIGVCGEKLRSLGHGSVVECVETFAMKLSRLDPEEYFDQLNASVMLDQQAIQQAMLSPAQRILAITGPDVKPAASSVVTIQEQVVDVKPDLESLRSIVQPSQSEQAVPTFDVASSSAASHSIADIASPPPAAVEDSSPQPQDSPEPSQRQTARRPKRKTQEQEVAELRPKRKTQEVAEVRPKRKKTMAVKGVAGRRITRTSARASAGVFRQSYEELDYSEDDYSEPVVENCSVQKSKAMSGKETTEKSQSTGGIRESAEPQTSYKNAGTTQITGKHSGTARTIGKAQAETAHHQKAEGEEEEVQCRSGECRELKLLYSQRLQHVYDKHYMTTMRNRFACVYCEHVVTNGNERSMVQHIEEKHDDIVRQRPLAERRDYVFGVQSFKKACLQPQLNFLTNAHYFPPATSSRTAVDKPATHQLYTCTLCPDQEPFMCNLTDHVACDRILNHVFPHYHASGRQAGASHWCCACGRLGSQRQIERHGESDHDSKEYVREFCADIANAQNMLMEVGEAGEVLFMKLVEKYMFALA